MALLDPRVNRVMYNRLKRYGFANPRFHPPALHPFSSVVINGGGSWLQSSDWEFSLQSRFRADFQSKLFAFVVSDTPGVLEANGLYVATTLRRNDYPVYVQVSAIEFAGPPITTKKKPKDFVPFRNCVSADAIKRLESFALDSQGARPETCSPRVLFCTGASEWGIQLLPSFETEMFLLQFEWNPGAAAAPAGASEASTAAADAAAKADAAAEARNATCFKRRLYDGNKCNSTQPCRIAISSKMDAASCVDCNAKPHYFSFGTKKYVSRNADEECEIVPGPLESQGLHGDGPDFWNTSVYTIHGDIKPTALSCAEEKRRYVARKQKSGKRIRIVSDADHLDANPWCPFLPNLLGPFLEEQNDILEESWSALGAVYSGTYLETPVYGTCTPFKKTHAVLRVRIPLGCMAPFTYFWKHRGKGDEVADTNQLPPIHLRPHDYVFNGDPRKHPTYDTECTLEFTSVCSNAAAHTDPGSGLQVMECLQTFTPESAEGHQEILPLYHTYFHSQDELDDYVKHVRELQCEEKAMLPVLVEEVSLWNICLTETTSNGEKRVRVVGMKAGEACSIDVNKADFDSDVPMFHCRDGSKIRLCGPPLHSDEILAKQMLPALFVDSAFVALVKSAIETTHSNWCSASLHELLCLLNTQVLTDAFLSINEANILTATIGDVCHPLLPSYVKLDLNHMRLYTVRGVGTRLVIAEPYPKLSNWCFVAPTKVSTKGLGFCVFGTLENHPRLFEPDCASSEWKTTEIRSIESERVVCTSNGAFRLVGDPSLFADPLLTVSEKAELQEIMQRFCGTWYGNGKESLEKPLKAVSSFYGVHRRSPMVCRDGRLDFAESPIGSKRIAATPLPNTAGTAKTTRNDTNPSDDVGSCEQ